jgi:hypothetical protein
MEIMSISSSAFIEGQSISAKYTCKGLNFSPPLSWRSLPGGTKSLALICEDPDASGGTFTHWVLYNMPASLNGLPEGVPQVQQAPGIGTQGTNDFQHTGYDGPCPPPGNPHRYFFTLFALDMETLLPPAWRSSQLQSRVKDHILASAQIMGTFHRL